MCDIAANNIVESVAHALETLAFVCIAPVDGEVTLPQSPVRCSICCHGSLSFRLNMIAPLGLGHTVAANMLGTDPNDPQATDRALDSLREVMNVSCGALCARLGDSRSVNVNLELPDSAQIEDINAAWALALKCETATVLDADGHAVVIWLEALK